MSDCSTDFLPKEMIYYTATKISRRGQTRFDIDTHLFNPIINRPIQLKLPIESVLLYRYRTQIDASPTKLFTHTLEHVNFTTFRTIILPEGEDQKIHEGQDKLRYLNSNIFL